MGRMGSRAVDQRRQVAGTTTVFSQTTITSGGQTFFSTRTLGPTSTSRPSSDPGSPSSSSKPDSSWIGIAAGVASGSVVFLLSLSLIVYLLVRRHKKRRVQEEMDQALGLQLIPTNSRIVLEEDDGHQDAKHLSAGLLYYDIEGSYQGGQSMNGGGLNSNRSSNTPFDISNLQPLPSDAFGQPFAYGHLDYEGKRIEEQFSITKDSQMDPESERLSSLVYAQDNSPSSNQPELSTFASPLKNLRTDSEVEQPVTLWLGKSTGIDQLQLSQPSLESRTDLPLRLVNPELHPSTPKNASSATQVVPEVTQPASIPRMKGETRVREPYSSADFHVQVERLGREELDHLDPSPTSTKAEPYSSADMHLKCLKGVKEC